MNALTRAQSEQSERVILSLQGSPDVPPALLQYSHRLASRLIRILADPRFSTTQRSSFQRFLDNFSPAAREKRKRFRSEYGIAPEGYVLGITDRCNLNCAYCYSRSSPSRLHDISTCDATMIIKEMAGTFGITFVTVSGGETFPRILDIAGANPDTLFLAYTNGSYIDSSVAREVKSLGNVWPALTLLGDVEVHDAVRGKGSFCSVMQAAESLSLHNVVWGFSVTESKANLERILDGSLLDMCQRRNPFFVRMIPYVSSGRRGNTTLALNELDRRAVANILGSLKSKHDFVIYDYVHDDELGIGCMAGGLRYFYISPDLQIHPCVFMDVGEKISVDRQIGRTNIVELLISSPIMIRARKMARHNRCVVLDVRGWRSALVG